TTSSTVSATIARGAGSSPRSASTTTRQVHFVTGLGTKPNLAPRSTIGTTLPRRLMTPRMVGGAFGTDVHGWYSMTSRTRRIVIAHDSPPRVKIKYSPATEA